MKKILIGLIVVTGFLFQACDEELSGDDYDFSTSLPPYVTINNVDTLDVSPGDTIPISFSMRTALQQEATVTYTVTGAVSIPNTVVTIERNKTSATASIPIPVTTGIPALAKILIANATKQDGSPLTIGQKNNPKIEKVIRIQ
ncbi:hypothetical protein [Adhaeribacter pallidiroseus]|uniref:DUF4843 domain-containing protein n=1 Tax=Adhaeribacter pallidiroseus TaxID=2072847 RepID=A0A369QJC3_9BACT|nr:hypothetical protein [Adhaeribacter pallidiroseus]RDC64492.1 hypothetical protein AHMF7616_03106 [Adhaeribacter pallidiroseus]